MRPTKISKIQSQEYILLKDDGEIKKYPLSTNFRKKSWSGEKIKKIIFFKIGS